MAGSKSFSWTADKKYRIKHGSERESWVFCNMEQLALQGLLIDGGKVTIHTQNSKGAVTQVQYNGNTLTLEKPIIPPKKGDCLIAVRNIVDLAKMNTDDNIKIADVKIGFYTKSQTQMKSEGFNPLTRLIKDIEHGIKDRTRNSREHGFDNSELIKATDLGLNDLNKKLSREASNTHMRDVLATIANQISDIEHELRRTPVTFIGSSLLIALNITVPSNSKVFIIDPDHPIYWGDQAEVTSLPASMLQGAELTPMLVQKYWKSYCRGLDNLFEDIADGQGISGLELIRI
ncbi:hypothetical protein [Celerinatantimonas sp. YJH-8]|uniref:hypothetical protein n=1 Tax=Celerinatantimonas sp. YJH-8 TaxID=3228714 RepID=UPI0038C931E0